MLFNKEGWVRETLPPIAGYIGLDLALTTIFVIMSPSSVDIGAIRPENAIPPKLLQLVLVGLALGFVASFSFRKVDLNLLTLFTAFVVLLDADHIPAALGFQQPIRPAHSIAFLLALLAVLSFTIRRQPEVEFVAVSAFLGHMAADTGEFALFAPFSFAYSSLDPYRAPLAIGAVIFALLAGYVKYRRYRKRLSLQRKEITVNESKTQSQSKL